MLPSRLQQYLGAFIMLLVEEYSETGPFRHLSNHTLQSTEFRKYFGYEGHRFFENVQN